jgi:hypothetical protein
MRFTTENGFTYWVKKDCGTVRETSVGGANRTLTYSKVADVYVGSAGAIFVDAGGNTILRTARIETVEGSPNDRVTGTGESGHVVFRTQNSSYEIDQEQKLVRRLAGLNPATNSQGLDGDWQPYDSIEGLDVGFRAVIRYPGTPKVTITSRIREVEGEVIKTPPPPPPLAAVVAMVKNEMPDV